MNPLPNSTTSRGGEGLRCPWCLSYEVEHATVRLEALRWSHETNNLARVAVTDVGCPDVAALTADCPECARPFVVKLSSYTGCGNTDHFLRLMPMRTEADFKLLDGAWSVSKEAAVAPL